MTARNQIQKFFRAFTLPCLRSFALQSASSIRNELNDFLPGAAACCLWMSVAKEKGSGRVVGLWKFQAKACQDSSSGCGHRVRCWLDRRLLPSRLFDDLVFCALGPNDLSTSHWGAREQRARLSPAVSAMVWWGFPCQVWEELPRRTWQSHSSFPQPTVFEELCQFAQCFYSGWLVLPAYGELFGPVAVAAARISKRGLSDQSRISYVSQL